MPERLALRYLSENIESRALPMSERAAGDDVLWSRSDAGRDRATFIVTPNGPDALAVKTECKSAVDVIRPMSGPAWSDRDACNPGGRRINALMVRIIERALNTYGGS